ncbi:MAG TPA: RagB/SusD family nutrient uptake outer membrane protein, partial [Segetibacter sp.]
RPVYLSAFITDEIRLGTGATYRNVGNGLFNYQYSSDAQDFRDDEPGGIWRNLYSVIDRANRVLAFMELVPTTNDAEVALKAQYRGELLGLRAMAHIELLRWYASTVQYSPDAPGVVLQTEYVKSPATYFPSRSTQAVVVAAINKDLVEARTLIPAGFADISRITRNAIIAFQARVAQHTGNWQAVVDRSTEVLALQPITPRGGYAAIWTSRTLASNQSTEVIWKLNVQSANLGVAVGSLFQDANAAVQASPALKLINSYDKTNDIRFPTFFRATPAPTGLIAKYGAVENSNGENFQYDIKMVRSSELLLARAEANAELGQLASANNDLATLRAARIANYVHVNITDKTALINEVLLERYRELAFEGQRYHDLRRRALPIQRDIQDVAGSASIQTLLPTDPRYLLPIPQPEVFANPNIGQNAGY